ncbi:MAG: hypothetical protein HC887_13185, partial [Desulfobacteraceae bacterium]|nr:hypothetical protein [Desulfobacteraceae bacterium]
MMKIPPSAGLVSLSINGKAVDSPVLDKQGQLWLQKRAQAGAQEDVQEIATYRLINDLIPMEVVTHLQLKISGQAREIRLNNVLLNASIPMKIESPLPIRMGRDNDFQIQARPGQWQIRIYARFDGPIHELSGSVMKSGHSKSQNDLRMAEIGGAMPIEPKQTDNPSDWKEFPAYIIKPDTKLTFKEIRRGDPDPAPDRLNLERTWWLDFDGKGFTIQDNITGTMSKGWYLSMNPPGNLGRVSVDN